MRLLPPIPDYSWINAANAGLDIFSPLRSYALKSFDDAVDALVGDARNAKMAAAAEAALKRLVHANNVSEADALLAKIAQRKSINARDEASAIRRSVGLSELPDAIARFLILAGQAPLLPPHGQKTLPAYSRAAELEPDDAWTLIIFAILDDKGKAEFRWPGPKPLGCNMRAARPAMQATARMRSGRLSNRSCRRPRASGVRAKPCCARFGTPSNISPPKDFPPFTTVRHYFYRLRDNGALDLLNEALVCAARTLCGRAGEPTAAIIDSQSVKTTESGGPRGGVCLRAGQGPDPMDAGKKIKGRKRHIVTDTQGHMLTGIMHEASVQDRDGAPRVIGLACEFFPTIAHIFADSGYAGEKLETALAQMNELVIEIVKRPDGAKGFVLVARRWVVERTLAWINRCRRLAKDWEASSASSEAWMLIASIRQLARRIVRLGLSIS